MDVIDTNNQENNVQFTGECGFVLGSFAHLDQVFENIEFSQSSGIVMSYDARTDQTSIRFGATAAFPLNQTDTLSATITLQTVGYATGQYHWTHNNTLSGIHLSVDFKDRTFLYTPQQGTTVIAELGEEYFREQVKGEFSGTLIEPGGTTVSIAGRFANCLPQEDPIVEDFSGNCGLALSDFVFQGTLYKNLEFKSSGFLVKSIVANRVDHTIFDFRGSIIENPNNIHIDVKLVMHTPGAGKTGEFDWYDVDRKVDKRSRYRNDMDFDLTLGIGSKDLEFQWIDGTTVVKKLEPDQRYYKADAVFHGILEAPDGTRVAVNGAFRDCN